MALTWTSEKPVARTGQFTAEVEPDGNRWAWRVLRRECDRLLGHDGAHRGEKEIPF